MDHMSEENVAVTSWGQYADILVQRQDGKACPSAPGVVVRGAVGSYTIFCFGRGWKTMLGVYDPVSSDQLHLMGLHHSSSAEHSIRSMLLRERLIPAHHWSALDGICGERVMASDVIWPGEYEEM